MVGKGKQEWAVFAGRDESWWQPGLHQWECSWCWLRKAINTLNLVVVTFMWNYLCPLLDPSGPQQSRCWWSEASRGPPRWQGVAALATWGEAEGTGFVQPGKGRALREPSNSHMQSYSATLTLCFSYQSVSRELSLVLPFKDIFCLSGIVTKNLAS